MKNCQISITNLEGTYSFVFFWKLCRAIFITQSSLKPLQLSIFPKNMVHFFNSTLLKHFTFELVVSALNTLLRTNLLSTALILIAHNCGSGL